MNRYVESNIEFRIQFVKALTTGLETCLSVPKQYAEYVVFNASSQKALTQAAEWIRLSTSFSKRVTRLSELQFSSSGARHQRVGLSLGEGI
jgi:hypothetical protein